MEIFKACFFSNGSHSISTVICEKITDTAIVIARTAKQIEEHHSTKHIISQRQTHNIRYCETEQEARDYLSEKYRLKINELRNYADNLQDQRDLLINEATA